MMHQENPQGNIALWASAFIVAALVFVMAGRHTQNAYADSASTANGFTLLTTSSGQGADLLYLIDQETSMLIVYNLKNPQINSEMELVAAWYLPSMFNTAFR
jgi:hypothetical protein